MRNNLILVICGAKRGNNAPRNRTSNSRNFTKLAAFLTNSPEVVPLARRSDTVIALERQWPSRSFERLLPELKFKGA